MSKHTPGPWRLVTLASSYDSRMKGYGIAYGRSGNRLALVDGEGNSSHDNEANARLIAAAPTMLERFRWIAEHSPDEIAAKNAREMIALATGDA